MANDSGNLFSSLFGSSMQSEKTQSVSSGRGQVHPQTIRFGDDVIVVRSIGSLFIVEEVLNRLPWILLLIASIPLAFVVVGFLTGGFALYKLLTAKPDVFLSIGTADGKRLNIVSKDRAFLEKVLEQLRLKIDADRPELFVGEINIDNRQANITASGGVVIGDHSKATGDRGSIYAS